MTTKEQRDYERLKQSLRDLCGKYSFVEVLARLRDLVDDEDGEALEDDPDLDEDSPRMLSDQLDGAIELASELSFELDRGKWLGVLKKKRAAERARREAQQRKFQEQIDRQNYERLRKKFEEPK